MSDVFTSRKRSQVMSRIRSQGNKETEIVLLSILRSHKISGWRRHLPLPGRPDFAFPKERLILFVDGCFWHGCPCCYRRPKSRTSYWNEKFQRNKNRDREVGRILRRKGWRVMRIWHHELRYQERIAGRIRRLVGL